MADETFEKFSEIIDRSLSRYKSLSKYSYEYSTDWSASSKTLAFQIRLLSTGWNYQLSFSAFTPLPYRFLLKPRPDWMRRFRATFGLASTKMMQVLFGTDAPDFTEGAFLTLTDQLDFFDSVESHKYGVSARRKLRTDDELDNWPDRLADLITFIRYLVNWESVTIVEEGTVCPFCRSLLGTEETNVRCRECKTLHHQECWEEIDRCSVFGCRNRKTL